MLIIDPSNTAGIRTGAIAVTRWPGGYWTVKIARRGCDTVAFAAPRRGTTGDPFDIAVAIGSLPGDVVALRTIAVDWVAQACTLAGRTDACIYGGEADQNMLDQLLVARAADEFNLTHDAAVTRRGLEHTGQMITPCGNTYGDDSDALMCERAAGHSGPCAALVLFPAPTTT